MRTILTADTYRRFFQQKNFFTVEKLWLFGLFAGDKGDNTDMWMIKITIKANQIDMDVLLISKVDNIQKPYLSLKSGFFHYFIGLWILPSRTNMVPKINRGLYALENCSRKTKEQWEHTSDTALITAKVINFYLMPTLYVYEPGKKSEINIVDFCQNHFVFVQFYLAQTCQLFCGCRLQNKT